MWSEAAAAYHVCDKLRQIASDDAAFLSRVISANKSWIDGYGRETKQQISQWKSPNLPRPKNGETCDIKGTVYKQMCPGRPNYCDV
jgi:hypothetical protein